MTTFLSFRIFNLQSNNLHICYTTITYAYYPYITYAIDYFGSVPNTRLIHKLRKIVENKM